MAHQYLAAFQLKAGKTILHLTTDIDLPGATVHDVAQAPASLKTYFGSEKAYQFEFTALPGMLSELANWLAPHLADPMEFLNSIQTAQDTTPAPAGNAYEDAGMYVAGTDRLLSWLLAADNHGLEKSKSSTASSVAKSIRKFLDSPERAVLVNRLELLNAAARIEKGRPDMGDATRNICRVIFALATEYQPWESFNPQQPYEKVVYAKGPKAGTGNLRRLAEYGAAHAPEAERPAYYEALAQQLLAAVTTPEPLPYAYPCTRQRTQLTGGQLWNLSPLSRDN